MSEDTHTEDPNTSAQYPQEHGEKMWCPIIELRQYLHYPGRRDAFIALFDASLIEEQERYGAFILGQFRACTDPDRFVWLRGFADMPTRQTALHNFYHVSPLWQTQRTAVNDMIRDVSNVFLLKPACASMGFGFDPTHRPLKDASEVAGGVVIVTIYACHTPVDPHFVDFFENTMLPLLRQAGATPLGHFVTEPAENTYPDLPVREGENVFVWLASFTDEAAYRTYQSALSHDKEWITAIGPALQTWGVSQDETLELLPTRRSLVRHRGEELSTRKDGGE